jgi:single-strand DNA-binding protein
MASFNKVVLMGNLTRDPDVRMTGASGLKVARLGLAINERRRDRNGQMQDFPVFVDVDAWDRLAELCGQHLTKGSPVLVEGRLQMDTWERDGVKHQKIKVRATLIKFLSRGDRPNGGYSRGVDQSGYGASDHYGDSPF